MSIVKVFIFNILIILVVNIHGSFGQTQPHYLDSVAVHVNIDKDLTDSLTTLPNTHAKLKLPKFFEPFKMDKHEGFIHRGTSTTILGFEYPGTPFTALTKSLSDSTFSSQGAELLQIMQFKLSDGREATAYILRFKTSTADVIRIMYFTGDYQTTYYLIANIPEVVVKLISSVILSSFQTLEY